MHKNSWNSVLASMALGEKVYIETSLSTYLNDMRVINTPVSRRPEVLKGKRFSTSLYTAVGSKAGEVRYLICLERKE